jgi:hypothetical protein
MTFETGSLPQKMEDTADFARKAVTQNNASLCDQNRKSSPSEKSHGAHHAGAK